MSEELVYYNKGSVKVTKARAIIGSKTYAMSNVTSVSVTKESPKTTVPILLIIIGALGVLFGVMTGFKGEGLGCLGAGVVLALVGFALARNANAKYVIKLGSASGESDALSSYDETMVREIAAALNKAIVDRG